MHPPPPRNRSQPTPAHQVLYDELPGVGWAWFPSGHLDPNKFEASHQRATVRSPQGFVRASDVLSTGAHARSGAAAPRRSQSPADQGRPGCWPTPESKQRVRAPPRPPPRAAQVVAKGEGRNGGAAACADLKGGLPGGALPRWVWYRSPRGVVYRFWSSA
jgi:hypothetical protein